MKAAAVAADESFVTLGIDREVFAVPVEMVLEILDMCPVFRIPEAPAHLKGLIDMRGRAVPAIDLRTKLGLPPVPADRNTRIVVLEIPLSDRRLALGLIVDRVFDVITLSGQQIEPAPDIGMRWNSEYIRGIGRRLDTFVVVLDLARLFAIDAANLTNAQTKPLPTDGSDAASSAHAA
jgi:purine-binding chemotaxis protein CheW